MVESIVGTVAPIRYHHRTYREAKGMVESGVTRDVAKTYREALQREGKDLPAYNLALSVYLGHFPTVSHDAACQAVTQIIAADFDGPERGRGY